MLVETTGKPAYLYLTRFNVGGVYADRHLVRIPVEFFPSNAEAFAIAPSTLHPSVLSSVPGRHAISGSLVG